MQAVLRVGKNPVLREYHYRHKAENTDSYTVVTVRVLRKGRYGDYPSEHRVQCRTVVELITCKRSSCRSPSTWTRKFVHWRHCSGAVTLQQFNLSNHIASYSFMFRGRNNLKLNLVRAEYFRPELLRIPVLHATHGIHDSIAITQWNSSKMRLLFGVSVFPGSIRAFGTAQMVVPVPQLVWSHPTADSQCSPPRTLSPI